MKSVSRRSFLAASAAGATLAATAGGCSLFVKSREPDVTVPVVDGAFRVALADQPALAKPGGTCVVALDGGPVEKVILFRRPGGGVSALDIECTHLGCDVDYAADRDRIVCPCHGSEYDPWGRNLKGPAKEPLESYDVREESGTLIVKVLLR